MANIANITPMESGCPVDNTTYPTFLGVDIAVPQIEAILTILTLTCIIIFTIVGNILVILSVFTHKPLRTVQNFFIVSLAVADMMVAILVLPLNVAYSVLGTWVFGKTICKIWLTSDVLCCTASILNLCAIALDRYWAITDPINYALKRTVKRVLWMICIVWVLSAIISSPPLLGWNDWPQDWTEDTACQLTEQPGYIIYSSSGSFFIPLFIMAIVYAKIFIATKRRLRERANQTNNLAQKNNVSQTTMGHTDKHIQQDNESASSDNAKEHESVKKAEKKKSKKKKKGESLLPNGEDSTLENQEGSSGSQRGTEYTPVKEGTKGQTFRVDQFIEEKQRISLSRERRAARTLGIIMGVFVVCWLPFFLLYVIRPFCGDQCCPTPRFTNFITWLGYINSALNPIIYTIFNKDFRKAFKKLLRIPKKK